MGETTKIQWTDHTFNPWVGCSKVHAGCANCYAEADMDKRRHFAQWGAAGTRVKTSESNWRKPLKWDREAKAAGVRRRVFCASLADIFEDWQGPIQNHERQQLYVSDEEPGRYPAVPLAGLESLTECERENITNGVYRPATMSDLRNDLFRLIDSTEWLDWLVLTKRPENVVSMWPSRADFEYIPEAGSLNEFSEFHRYNVWLGTSVSNQATADEQVPKLLGCAKLADVLFVSAEPLLGPIDLRCLQHQGLYEVNALTGANGVNRPLQGTGPKLQWVIVGGESGPGARPFRPSWVRSIQRDCRAYGVPVFVKQMGGFVVDRNDSLGGWEPNMWPEEVEDVEHDIHGFREEYQGADIRIRLKDSKGGDPLEWPPDLRQRQFPIPF